MSFITLKNGSLTVVISTLGAELQSIRDAKGEEYLWQGDERYWTGRAPILFPIAGGLKDDQYTFEGRTYPMQKHGYVRKVEWETESVSETEAVLRTGEKAEGFPFDYALRAVYRLEGKQLHVTYRVDNLGDRPFAFGLGAHEGYATPGGIEKYSLHFERTETFAHHPLHGNLIQREPVILAGETAEFPLRYRYFSVDALVFPDLHSRSVTLFHHRTGPRLRVDYPGHDVLMLWTKPEAPYICIEPWLNAPDFLDADGDITRKPGCVLLDKAETVSYTHTITIM